MNQDANQAPETRLTTRRVMVGLLVLSLVAFAVAAVGGGTISAWLSDAEARRAEAAVADSLRTTDDLLAWITAHPDVASLVVLDGDSVQLAVSPATTRPVVGLPTLQLAAELSRRADAGLDLSVIVPGSVVEKQRLPELEPDVPAGDALTLASLARAALEDDRAAADALLLTLGRADVDMLPQTIGLDSLDAAVPIGGLMVAWSSGRMALSPADELAAFLNADRAAQRDSAFARSLALDNSPSFRAELTARYRHSNLRLTARNQRRAALATFPLGRALAYGRLLSRADGTFLRLVTSQAPSDIASQGITRIGVHVGSGPALRSVSGLASRENAANRAVVLSLSDAPQAVLDHLENSGLDRAMVRDLLLR